MAYKIQYETQAVERHSGTNPWEYFNSINLPQYNMTGKDIDDEPTFYLVLHMLLNSTSTLNEFFMFDELTGVINNSYFLLYHTKETDDGGIALDSMNEIRDIIDSYPSLYAIDYCSMYPIWDSNNVVEKETWTNLIFSAIGVAIVLLALLTVWTSILVLINILLIDVCVVGWVPALGLELNSVTCCCIVLSVGIAVDYSAHIANRFLLSVGTKSQRAANSVVVMCRNLLSGGIASILGIFMLAFANVSTNRIFFQMMYFLFIILGLVY